MSQKSALIIVENSFVPLDIRVWSEATALRDAGWRVAVICPAVNGVHNGREVSSVNCTPENLDGVSVYRFPLTFAEQGILSYLVEYVSAFLFIARLSWRIWQNRGFDIAHFCNPPDVFFPIALLYRFLGARVVFDHHDLFPEFVAWRYRGPIGRVLYVFARVMEYLTFRSANVVMSTNRSYRRIAIERGGMQADHVVVVRNGPKIDEFAPVEPDVNLKQGFPYLACYAGVMGHEDGVLELIAAIRYVVHDLGRRDILFALLGDGSARPQALADVTSWGLEPYVDMPGMVHDKLLVRRYMSTADICLSPEPPTPLNEHSTFIKIGEYMAMGKPIVAYDLDETRYTAQQAAIYVEPGNIQEFGRATAELMDESEQRQHMGEIGRRRILDELGWEYQQEQLLRAYAIALSQNGK
jgi:glycosyltransferase involved in cell wall biosynthesis